MAEQEIHDRIVKLFTEGFPPIDIIPLPAIPAVMVAKMEHAVSAIIDENSTKAAELAGKIMDKKIAAEDKEISILTQPDVISPKQEPITEPTQEPSTEPTQKPNQEPSTESNHDKEQIGGSIRFTLEECTFF